MPLSNPHPLWKALLLAGLSLFGATGQAAEEGVLPARRTLPMESQTPDPTSTPVPVPLAKLEDLAALESRNRAAMMALSAQVKALEDRIANTAEATQALQRSTADSVKRSGEIWTEVERKGERMESLLDLMSTLKRDVHDNAHEIAELKQTLEKMRGQGGNASDGGAPLAWWDQIAQWRYMPVAAAVLAAAALSLAASHAGR